MYCSNYIASYRTGSVSLNNANRITLIIILSLKSKYRNVKIIVIF